MKKILSLTLAALMMVSMIPTAYATTNYTNGTQVSYNAEADNDGDGVLDNQEAYTVTVPAQLAPEGSGNVVASGTWSSARKLVVTADTSITLTNSINSADQKVLTVTFPGIALEGSNTAAVTNTKVVSVGAIENALFGTWSGTFNYNVEMVNTVELISFTGYSLDGQSYSVEPGTTWAEWAADKNFAIDSNCLWSGNGEYEQYGFDVCIQTADGTPVEADGVIVSGNYILAPL